MSWGRELTARRVAANRRKDLLQTFVVLGIVLTPAWLTPGQTFCELGCGDARLLVWVREATGATCVGIEAAPLLVGIARLRAAWAGGGGITIRLDKRSPTACPRRGSWTSG